MSPWKILLFLQMSETLRLDASRLSCLPLFRKRHLANFRAAQDNQQIGFLSADIPKPLWCSWRKGNRVPRSEDDLIFTLVSPEKGAGTGQHHKHLGFRMAMQRGAFARTDLIDGHGKAVVARDRRTGLSRPTNQRIPLGAIGFVSS